MAMITEEWRIKSKLDLTKTRAAVTVYDAGAEERDRMIDEADTNEALFAWEKRRADDRRLVCLAFYEDTKDRNSLATILMTIDVEGEWFRSLLKDT